MWLGLLYLSLSVAALTIILEKLYYRLRIDFNTPKEQTMDELEPQSLPRFYFCAVMQAFHLSAGKFYPALPGETMTKPDPDSPATFYPPRSEKMLAIECSMRHDRLRLYRECIGYSGDPKQLPPVFMSAYFNKAIIALGASQFSRIRILDLRHLIRENFHVSLINEKYEETPKGIQCTLRASVYDLSDTLVWEALLVGLSVSPKRKSTRKTPQADPAEFIMYKQEEINAPLNIGVDFAYATQDWQPQHLTKWTSKLVGFSSPIAHGLWSMAVAVDRVMANEKATFQDKYPLHLDVQFKKPLFLPGKALLQFDKPSGASGFTHFQMVNSKSLSPILTGSMHVGERMAQ
ncbi:dehydratase [Plakobranchus ocellatus]|uniref:Dehydratase n=1 Tax=Plakobranchus ocellatus TaxID=259542 RepID=A0AAV4AW04_9GAST|nr:dehydratase [Plakobranchus ocellatus]